MHVNDRHVISGLRLNFEYPPNCRSTISLRLQYHISNSLNPDTTLDAKRGVCLECAHDELVCASPKVYVPAATKMVAMLASSTAARSAAMVDTVVVVCSRLPATASAEDEPGASSPSSALAASATASAAKALSSLAASAAGRNHAPPCSSSSSVKARASPLRRLELRAQNAAQHKIVIVQKMQQASRSQSGESKARDGRLFSQTILHSIGRGIS